MFYYWLILMFRGAQREWNNKCMYHVENKYAENVNQSFPNPHNLIFHLITFSSLLLKRIYYQQIILTRLFLALSGKYDILMILNVIIHHIKKFYWFWLNYAQWGLFITAVHKHIHAEKHRSKTLIIRLKQRPQIA